MAADPANLEYRTMLGAALSDLKQYDRAVGELGKVTEAPGYKRAEAWIYLGAAHLGAKRYKDAIAALDKAAAAAPDNVQTEAYLAWSYFGLKDAPGFKRHAGKAKALGHKDPRLLERLHAHRGRGGHQVTAGIATLRPLLAAAAAAAAGRGLQEVARTSPRTWASRCGTWPPTPRSCGTPRRRSTRSYGRPATARWPSRPSPRATMKLDEAERHVRTAAANQTLDTLRKQVRQVQDMCP